MIKVTRAYVVNIAKCLRVLVTSNGYNLEDLATTCTRYADMGTLDGQMWLLREAPDHEATWIETSDIDWDDYNDEYDDGAEKFIDDRVLCGPITYYAEELSTDVSPQ